MAINNDSESKNSKPLNTKKVSKGSKMKRRSVFEGQPTVEEFRDSLKNSDYEFTLGKS